MPFVGWEKFSGQCRDTHGEGIGYSYLAKVAQLHSSDFPLTPCTVDTWGLHHGMLKNRGCVMGPPILLRDFYFYFKKT